MTEQQHEAEALAAQVGQALEAAGASVVTAESCTGGWIAQVLTAIPGSSNWFERGFVTYSNTAKRELLGVKTDILARFGAVSEQTARAMAEGALAASPADFAVAVTGVAGPGGGTAEKPVGMVCFAWAGRRLPTRVATYRLAGDRAAVRYQSVIVALQGLLEFVRNLR